MEQRKIEKGDTHIFPHDCQSKAIEVHGHLQCSVCGRLVESCCEGGPISTPNNSAKKSK